MGRLQAHDTAERSGHADRAPAVGADGEGAEPEADRARRTAGRAARRVGRVVGIAGRAVVGVEAGDADADPEQGQEETMDEAEAQVSMDEMADQEEGDETEMPEGEAPLEPPAPAPISDADPNYQVFLTEFDEEIAAEDLAEPVELERLRAYLDQLENNQ